MNSHLNQRLFFLHIPKTAGMSVNSYLSRHFDGSKILDAYDWNELQHISQSELESKRLIMGHFEYDFMHKLLPEPPQTITFLRDPIQRTLSAFNHLRRDTNHQLHERLGGTQATLTDYLTNDFFIKTGANQQTRFLSTIFPDLSSTEDISFARQQNWQTSLHKPPDLATAKQVLAQIDFFGLLEEFSDSMMLLAHTLELPPPEQLPHVNTASGKSQTITDCTSDEMKLLHEYNEIDIELYDYARQLFYQRRREFLLEKFTKPLREKYPALINPQPSVDLTLDQPFSGEGWHKPEFTENGEPYCWTGSENVSTALFALQTEGDALLEVLILREAIPYLLRTLKLEVNNLPLLYEQHELEGGHVLLQAIIPHSILVCIPDVLQLTLTLRRTQILPELSEDGMRKVGIAISRIKVSPLAS